jgi:hypothetical protein
VQQGENVGTYAITPTGEAVQGNYSCDLCGRLRWRSRRARQNRQRSNSNTLQRHVYDANAHTITASAEQDSSTLYYSKVGGTTRQTGARQPRHGRDVTEAQTVYVKATNPNYEDSFGSGDSHDHGKAGKGNSREQEQDLRQQMIRTLDGNGQQALLGQIQ